MKRILMFLVLVLMLGMGFRAYATDHLFLHNGDGITLTRSGEDLVEFSFYSISGRSRIDVTCAGAGSGVRIFTNGEGWQTHTCQGGIATITIREVGCGAPKKDSQGYDIPGDSDVVIRFGSGIKESNLKGVDDSKKGTKCTCCGKTLSW